MKLHENKVRLDLTHIIGMSGFFCTWLTDVLWSFTGLDLLVRTVGLPDSPGYASRTA